METKPELPIVIYSRLQEKIESQSDETDETSDFENINMIMQTVDGKLAANYSHFFIDLS